MYSHLLLRELRLRHVLAPRLGHQGLALLPPHRGCRKIQRADVNRGLIGASGKLNCLILYFIVVLIILLSLLVEHLLPNWRIRIIRHVVQNLLHSFTGFDLARQFPR